MELKKVIITENQRKVIQDKYLKDSPSVEAWLDLVATNVALADLLYSQTIREEEIFNGINYEIEEFDTIPGQKTRALFLHKNFQHYDEWDKNFKRFIENLYKIAETEESKKVIEPIREKFYNMLSNFEFLPNSPTLMNAGRKLQQLSACYVLPVGDSIEEIFDSVKHAAMIHKSGGGTGFSFSRLRPTNDPVKSTHGVASGPLTFMQIFDKQTDVIKQGGTRRGANMGILRYDHPDIMGFINMKKTPGVMENFNVSVAIDRKFMDKVKMGEDYELKNPKTKEAVGKLNAKEVWNLMIKGAWETGDPGFVVIDRINETNSNPTPHIGEIESTNPCGEQPLLPYEPCFAPDTLITTKNGLETIESLYEKQLSGKDIIIATDNKTIGKNGLSFRKALVSKTGYKEILEVELNNGQALKVTPNHKIYTKDGWKRADELKKEDKVVIQSDPIYEADNNSINFETNKKDLLFGWLSGDGWFLDGNRACAGICFGQDETFAQKTLIPSFKEILECNPSSYIDRNDVVQIVTEKKNSLEKLKKFGFKAGKAPKKEIPDYIFTAEPVSILAYLGGLFSADGEVSSHRRRIRLSSASPKLIKQVQMILLNFGIISRVSKSSLDKRVWYELAINGGSYDTFAELIGFPLALSKQELMRTKLYKKIRNRKENLFSEVRLVRSIGFSDVYDITEPETHSLIANGIIAHNCNLGSINLSKFVKEDNSDMDFERLSECTFDCVHFLDNVIEVNNYPLPQIEKIAKENRRIGLGVMGWAETLVMLGIPYNSKEAFKKAEQVMKCIDDAAMAASEELASVRGIFPNWKNSIFDKNGDNFRGQEAYPRNCARTTIAPTGTIGITAGLQGAGIEPFFAIAYTRYNAAGIDALKREETPADKDTFFEVNPLFRDIAEKNDYFGFEEKELWKRIEENHKSVVGIKEIPERIQNLFLTSHDLSPLDHVNMQCAFQKYTDNAVSKTVNLRNEATTKDVEEVYMKAYELGAKGVTIYRDGSKQFQILNISDKTKKKEKKKMGYGERSDYYEISTGQGPLHVHVNYDEDGPTKVFANISPIGTEISGLTTALGIMLSKYLENGGDPIKLIKHLNSVKGDKPFGFGPNKVDSIPHAISKVIRDHLRKTGKLKYLNGQTILNGQATLNGKSAIKNPNENNDNLYCPKCYSTNVEMVSGCSEPTCFDCGYSECS